MMVALALEDYDRFSYELVDLAPFSDHVDVDILSRQIRDVIAPYHGLTIENVNTGSLLLQTTSIAAKNNLMLPAELVLFFKSIVNIETLGKLIKKDFDALEYALEFSKDIASTKLDPTSLLKELSHTARDANSLIVSLPRHIKQILRRWNSPDHSVKISIDEIKDLRKSLNHSSSLLFLGIIIASLILSSSFLIASDQDPTTIPAVSIIGYTLAVLLSLVAVFDYIRR
jgi:ubiquinone biosynthesis protein